MDKSLKTVFLKAILHYSFEQRDKIVNDMWFGRYMLFCFAILDGIQFSDLEDISIDDLRSLDYVISLAEKTPEGSGLREFVLHLPGMREDFTYDPDTVVNYHYIEMHSQSFPGEPSTIVFNERGFTFEISIRFKNSKDDFNYNNLTFNLNVANKNLKADINNIGHLINVKDFILLQEIDIEKEGDLEEISKHVKLLKY